MLDHLINRALALLVPLVLLGCTEVIRAEFDLEAGTTMPSGPLPGFPLGDSAEVQGSVIAAGSGVSLFLSSGETPQLDLITGGKPHGTTDYWISFKGVKLTITDTPVMAIDTIDTRGQAACGLEIAGGEFRLVGGDGAQVIGAYDFNADQHNVLIRIAKNERMCHVVINQFPQGSGPGASPTMPTIESSAPIQDAAFGDLDTVRFAWEQVEADDGTQYFVDDVVASIAN